MDLKTENRKAEKDITLLMIKNQDLKVKNGIKNNWQKKEERVKDLELDLREYEFA